MSSSEVDTLGFNYCSLGTPVALTGNTAYYLVSSETAGGDTFSDDNSAVTLNSSTRNSSIYQSSGTWGSGTGPGSYGPVNLTFASGSGNGLLTTASPGTIRNNFTGNVGMRYTTSTVPYNVSAVGRYFVSGNSGSHTVGIYRSSDGSLIASCVVAMAGGSVDSLGFKYCSLSTPAVLAASTSYYVATSETSGGDSWSDDNSSVSPSSGTINNSIYQYGGTWIAGPGGGSYGPVNLR